MKNIDMTVQDSGPSTEIVLAKFNQIWFWIKQEYSSHIDVAQVKFK